MGFLAGKDRRGTAADVLVVGLGNPGSEFAGTRHNLGADVVALLARRAGGGLKRSRERALVAEVTMAGKRVVLAFPQTFMNLSGESVGALVRRHGIAEPAHVVIVHDELDLPVGRLQVKVGGGLAGHNGLKSIMAHLHSADFVRVRVGVGRPPGRREGADHVLHRPGKSEKAELDVSAEQAADAVEVIVAEGPAAAMNRFNVRPS